MIICFIKWLKRATKNAISKQETASYNQQNPERNVSADNLVKIKLIAVKNKHYYIFFNLQIILEDWKKNQQKEKHTRYGFNKVFNF